MIPLTLGRRFFGSTARHLYSQRRLQLSVQTLQLREKSQWVHDTRESSNNVENGKRPLFRGVESTEYTSQCSFVTAASPFKVLRYIKDGYLNPNGMELPFSTEMARDLLHCMLQVSVYDDVLNSIQRQGRISFYMTAIGEEAASLGISAALEANDVLFPQYRELPALLWRGLTVDKILNQVFGTAKDTGKGRQMPVHYSDKALGIMSISSPLATQIPHAAGAGYAYRLMDKNQCAVVFYGEGAASEGDFSTAVNIAATRGSRTLFICRNNAYAISTPVEEQYIGDGISARTASYGVPSIRVDGNDLVAVYIATREARKLCINENTPVSLELMTYRGGSHSTSDEASSYRSHEEAEKWLQPSISAIGRFEQLLVNKGLWRLEETVTCKKRIREELMTKIRIASKGGNVFFREVEKQKYLAYEEGLFDDVYDSMLWHLQEQKDELKAYIEESNHNYDLRKFEKLKL